MDPITLIAAASAAFKLAVEIRAALIQKGEWTEEQEAAWQARRSEYMSQPWWKPED